MVDVKVQTEVSAVHEIMITLDEDTHGLGAEPFFDGRPYIIIVYELPPFKCFLDCSKKQGNITVWDQGYTEMFQVFISRSFQQTFTRT